MATKALLVGAEQESCLDLTNGAHLIVSLEADGRVMIRTTKVEDGSTDIEITTPSPAYFEIRGEEIPAKVRRPRQKRAKVAASLKELATLLRDKLLGGELLDSGEIKQLIGMTGLTQVDFGKLLGGVSEKTVNRWATLGMKPDSLVGPALKLLTYLHILAAN